MLVKDIMSKMVVTVSPEMKLSEISGIMFQNRFHGLPVVEEGKLVGIITESDFFIKDAADIFLPSFVEFIGQNKILGKLSEEKEKELKSLLNIKARDIMSADCVTIFEDMSVEQLVAFFKTTNYKTLPVLNDKEELSGIVTRSDVLNLISISDKNKSIL